MSLEKIGEIRLEPMVHIPVSIAYVVVKDKDQYHFFPIVGGSDPKDKVCSELYPGGKNIFEVVYFKGVNYKESKGKVEYLTAVLNQKGKISNSLFRWVAEDALEAICNSDLIEE